VQARNEAAQWLSLGGAPPLLLKATLLAYRENWRDKHGRPCDLSDAELLAELLTRTEKP
jgi:hypothetical protein